MRPAKRGALLVALMVLASSCTWIARVNVATGGGQSSFAASGLALSETGRFAVFQSSATDLDGNHNGSQQIFLNDLVNNTTRMISRAPCLIGGGLCAAGNGDSSDPAISADGRYVVFQSDATNLAGSFPGDTNGVTDVFRIDTVNNVMIRVSQRTISGPIGPTIVQGDAASRRPDISGDGDSVVFDTSASNLAPGGNGLTQVQQWSPTTGHEIVSVATSGSVANFGASAGRISPDGNAVVFDSTATNLTTTPNTSRNVFHRSGGTTTQISFASTFQGLGDVASSTDIDGDGDRIGIVQTAFPGTATSAAVVSSAGTTILTLAGSSSIAIADDGLRIVWDSGAVIGTRLVDVSGTNQPVSTNLLNTYTGTGSAPVVSGDGTVAGFESDDPALLGVATDTNGVSDVFVKSIPRVVIDDVTHSPLVAGFSANMTITGSGFSDPLTIGLGPGVTASNVSLTGSTSITLVVSAQPGAALGPRDVVVVSRNLDASFLAGGSATCVGCVTVD